MTHARARLLPTRTSRAGTIAAGILLSLALAVGAALAGTVPAFAEGFGAGYFDPGGLGDLGAFRANDGTQAYCLDLTNERTAYNHPTDGGSYQQWGSDVAANARVNYVLTTYGQTGDNDTAAAVAMYVWDQLDNRDYNSHGMSGDTYYVARAPRAHQANILSLLNRFRAEAAGITPGGPHGQMTFAIATDNNYYGTLTVSGVGAATGTITLDNGIFADTGTNQISNVGDGRTLSVRGVPPEGTPDYRISATGVFYDPTQYVGDVKVYNIVGGGQAIAGAGQHPSFQLTSQDPFDRSRTFAPVLSTQASSAYVSDGNDFVDTVHFSTTSQPDGTNNPWAQRGDGSYLPVTANATIYGPFATPPIQATTAPAGAPIAGTATVTTGSQGPNVDYPVDSGIVGSTSGYYTWVWTIQYAAQQPLTQLFLPANYSFTDQYGQALETQVVPPTFSTAADPTGLLGFEVHDTATVTGTPFAGAQIGFKAYTRKGTATRTVSSFAARAQTSAASTAATGAAADPPTPTCDPTSLVYSSPLQPLTQAGTYPSPGAQLPLGTSYWVATIYDANGAPIVTAQCGVAGEITVITQISVTTHATPSAVAGAPASDTATMTGTVLPGDSIEFAAYRGPTTTTATCDATTQLWTSGAIPLNAGVVDHKDVTGPSTTFPSAGLVFWQETVRSSTGDVVAQGECGITPESTTITPKPVLPPSLALTGMTDPTPVLGGGIALFILGLAFVIGSTRTRRRREG